MIVTITDIQNAIYKAQNMVYAIALNITDCYEQGGQPSDEKYELATQLQSYIDVLGRVDLGGSDCIDSDEIWEIISWINGNQVLAEMCLVIPAQYSNPGQPIPVPDSGCCGVETVTGPQVDNTDPKHPVVGVYGDGTTITGAGTLADPFVAVGGGGGSGTVSSGAQYRLAYYAAAGTTVSNANAITAARALKSDANGVPTHFDTATEPSLTELTYVKGLTSAAQTQLNAKAPLASPTFTGTVTAPTVNVSGLTASELVATDGSKNLQSLAVATYPSLAEMAFVKGLTSAVQTQLNDKSPLASPTFTGTVTTPAIIVSSETANTVAILDGSKNIKSSAATSTQLLYVTKRLAKTAVSAAHTGTTANTWVDGLSVPANTFGAGDIIQVKSRVNKTTSTNTYTHRIYVNTVNSLAGSPVLIATAATSAAANRFQQVVREIEIMVANGTGAGTEVMTATTASTQDDVQQTDMTTCAIDWTVQQYIVCAIQLASAADSINNHFIITR